MDRKLNRHLGSPVCCRPPHAAAAAAPTNRPLLPQGPRQRSASVQRCLRQLWRFPRQAASGGRAAGAGADAVRGGERRRVRLCSSGYCCVSRSCCIGSVEWRWLPPPRPLASLFWRDTTGAGCPLPATGRSSVVSSRNLWTVGSRSMFYLVPSECCSTRISRFECEGLGQAMRVFLAKSCLNSAQGLRL